MTTTTFSEDTPVRVAIRIQEGRILAAPFDAAGVQTESGVDYGPVAGVDMLTLPQHISWVFGGLPVEG